MRLSPLLAAAAFAAFAHAPASLAQGSVPSPTPPATVAAAAPAEDRAPVTILISIDGFRADYLDRGVTPVLSRLAAGGVRAAMRPSFPSKTFPNHWTLVTGLRPDRNGIVANRMEDAARPGEVFTMATDDPFWWNEATPIWVDAERAGIRSATMFWPGSNVAIGGTLTKGGHGGVEGGTRPSDWMQFNQAITGPQRVNGILDWLRRPAAIRPRLLTLYFDTVDSAGHSYGPDDARTTRAVAEVDGQIGMLVDGLAALGQPANLVIVADHGMAATSSQRVVPLDSMVSLDAIHLVETGPYAALTPLPGQEATVEKALIGRHPHMECWRRQSVPVRFHYGQNPRVPAILCLAETGWLINEHAPTKTFSGGNHGYDHMSPEMAAVFIANGPAFRAGQQIKSFDNVDVYPLLRDLIGLAPRAGVDGTDAPFATVLAR